MISATSPIGLGASTVAVLASGRFLATILRHRSDPATRPVIGIAGTLLLGAVLQLGVVDLEPGRHALGIQWAPTESVGGFWMLIAFDLPAIVSVFWFLFALQYTGRDRKTTPITLSAVAILLVLLVGPNVALAAIGVVVGIPVSTFNTILGITIVLAESLALIGIFLVLTTTLPHKAFPAMQTALLTVAVGAVLTIPFLATTLQTPVATPVAITASALLFTSAIQRYRIFETLPVASVVGRDRVIDEMAEGVVMIDERGRIRDINPAAESMLGLTQSAVTGEPLDAVGIDFPDPNVLAASGPQDVTTDTARTVSVTVDSVTDDQGREYGQLLVCRDVTDERRREHRLSVLTQLVAGATTEQMSEVVAITADVVAGNRDPEDGGDRIQKTATDTVALVNHVRKVEKALANRDDDRAAAVDLREVLDDLRTKLDLIADGRTDDPSVRVSADPELLRATIETLAAGSGTGSETVELRVRERDNAVTIEVTPLDPETGSIPALALDIARLSAGRADWSVGTADGSLGPTAFLRLPAVRDDPAGRRFGSERA